MSAELCESVARAFFAAVERGDRAALLGFSSPKLVWRVPTSAPVIRRGAEMGQRLSREVAIVTGGARGRSTAAREAQAVPRREAAQAAR
jgi:ketosteroid isomerase-like protein